MPHGLTARTTIAALAALSLGVPAHAETAAPAADACAIYVSTTGTDHASCGLLPSDPCRTINNGVARAYNYGIATYGHPISCVNVQAGVYPEVVQMMGGVHVRGGFDVNWISGPYTAPANRVEIVGAADGVTGQSYTVQAVSTGTASGLANLILTGASAGAVAGGGSSSHVVFAKACTLRVQDVLIQAGQGASGVVGSAGADAPSLVAAPSGGGGGSAFEGAFICESTSRGAGGAAGTNGACLAGTVNPNGGAGGPGGTMDSDCNGPFGTCGNCDARPGQAGSPAVTNPAGTPGDGGPGGAGASTCGPGLNGSPGLVQNGAAGLAGVGLNRVGDLFVTSPGGPGALGQHGSGGGGGGGSGGCDIGTDSWGAGGGGGGAGGCRATAAGNGGTGGGSSIGILAISAVIEASGCDIARGAGGYGGAGGAGGLGQPGGAGGPGGAASGDSQAGGFGGSGAHGGHSGGGGGGQGGYSIGVLSCGSVLSLTAVSYSGGSAGAGGPGGNSPGDGNDGAAGASGVVETVRSTAVCATPAPTSASAPFPDCTTCTVVGVEPGSTAPGDLQFAGAAPMPASGRTNLSFGLPRAGHVRITIYDIRGRRVRVLTDGEYPGGMHTVVWDAQTDEGQRVPAGVYFARLEAEGRRVTKSVVLVN